MPAPLDLTDWFATVDQLRTAWTAEAPIELVQTHISAVLIGQRRVLKLKKPVNFGFLDYSTLEKRRQACEAEITLNRRLAPETYLRVAPVHTNSGIATVDGDGEVIDYGVLMKRLPADRMLDEMLARGQVSEALIEQVARNLAGFHAASLRTPEVEKWGEWEQIQDQWQENFDQTRPFINRTITTADFFRIENWVQSQLAMRERFDRRVRERRIVDGHGDLRCESICVTEPIQFYDCIEFSDRLRCCDAASEIAFLAMDLTSRGRPDLGYHLTASYEKFADDPGLRDLLKFYCCYRAWVRGKVLSFRLNEDEFTAEQRSRDAVRASEFFRLARNYTSSLESPSLVVVMGLSGTGKTALARGIAHRLGLHSISTDAVRQQLFGEEKQPSAFGTGAYTADAGARTYDELFRQAEAQIKRNCAVVMDGTFLDSARRAQAENVAGHLGANLLWIECTLPESINRERIERRLTLAGGHSDADWQIHLHQREQYTVAEPLLPPGRFVVDTSSPLSETVNRAVDWLLSR